MSVVKNVFQSSLILLATRFFQRGIGLVSMLVLARFLTPEDFGVVAIAMTIIYFFEAMSTLGSESYLIQKVDITNDDINSAWTLDILTKGFMWIVLIACAHPISEYYDNPKFIEILYVISSILILNAFKSPGIILQKMNYNYTPIFWLDLVQKVISCSLIISIAVVSHSYWAMIIGSVATALIMTVGSYFIHPFRPRFSIKKIREQWSFSQWVLVRGVVGYSRAQVDTIIVSMMFSSQILGKYYMLRNFSVLPITDIIIPALEPIFTAFSNAKKNIYEFRYQVRLSVLALGFTAAPVAVYVAFFPDAIIDLVLGDQWSGTYDILSAFSITLYFMAINQLFSTCCFSLAKVKQLFIYDFLSFVLFVGVLFLYSGDSIVEFILLRAALGVIATSCLMVYVSKLSGIPVIKLILLLVPAFLPPLLAALLVKNYNPFYSESVFTNFISVSVMYGILFLLFGVVLYLVYFRTIPEGVRFKEIVFKLLGGLFSRVKK